MPSKERELPLGFMKRGKEMTLVSQSDRGNPTCFTVVAPFPLILLTPRFDWGRIVGEENEETAFMVLFFLLQAALPQEILKAFHGTLTIPLISSTYLSPAITEREKTHRTQTHT